MKIGVRKGGVCEWWSSCQVPSADLAFLSLSASSQSWSQSSYLLGTVSGGKAAVVYYNVYIVSLVLKWLSNLEFRRRKKVVQVVQIGGGGEGGNLDKIQKNSSFSSGYLSLDKQIFERKKHYRTIMTINVPWHQRIGMGTRYLIAQLNCFIFGYLFVNTQI